MRRLFPRRQEACKPAAFGCPPVLRGELGRGLGRNATQDVDLLDRQIEEDEQHRIGSEHASRLRPHLIVQQLQLSACLIPLGPAAIAAATPIRVINASADGKRRRWPGPRRPPCGRTPDKTASLVPLSLLCGGSLRASLSDSALLWRWSDGTAATCHQGKTEGCKSLDLQSRRGGVIIVFLSVAILLM